MTPSEAAQVLGVSADSVRALSDSGRLPTLRTVSGRRLFWRGDVERLADERGGHSAHSAKHKPSRRDTPRPSSPPSRRRHSR